MFFFRFHKKKYPILNVKNSQQDTPRYAWEVSREYCGINNWYHLLFRKRNLLIAGLSLNIFIFSKPVLVWY